MIRVVPAVCAVLAVLAACGYVGEPLPPALHIPEPIGDLSALQRGDKIVLEFTLPSLTTEGLALDAVSALEIRGGTAPEGTFDASQWSSSARPIEGTSDRKGRLTVPVPIGDWADREVVFGVRTTGTKGRVSQWSNFVTLRVRPPLKTPRSLRAEVVAQGVQLKWESQPREGVQFRVLRQKDDEESARQIGLASTPEFLDTEAAYGVPHTYQVQAILGPAGKEAVSEMPAPVAVVPEDRFAPATPSGLTALAGTDSVELVWEPNREPDFRTYRVYRSVDDSEWKSVADGLTAPAFSDRDVMPGKRYRYSVTGVDERGNESARAEPFEIRLP